MNISTTNKKEKESLIVLRNSNSPQQEEDPPSIPHFCSKGGVKLPFPMLLMELLNVVDDVNPFVDYYGTSLRSIISWQPDGKCFQVHNKGLFENYVQQRYFTKQTNYASFRRQLNLWDFKRIAGPKTGPNFGAYYHPQFTRDDKYSCRLMRRPSSPVKNSNKKAKSTAAAAAAVSRSAKNIKKSCRYPRSQSSERVVPPHYPIHSPTAVVDHDMHMKSSVRSSRNNYISQRINSYSSSPSTCNFNLSIPHLLSRNPSHMVKSLEEACSYVQKKDEEMTVVADNSSKSNTVMDSTQFQDLLEDKYDESQYNNEEEDFQLPDCEPLQEEDVGVGSMEISLLHSLLKIS